MIERLAVIGVGLIGGSLARALRVAGAVGEVVGCGRQRANLERALALGVVDRYSHDIGDAVAGADMVFIAVPLGAVADCFAALRGRLRADAEGRGGQVFPFDFRLMCPSARTILLTRE